MPRPRLDKPDFKLVKRPGRESWYISWTGQDGQTYRSSTGTSCEHEAKIVLTEFAASYEANNPVDNPTIDEILDIYTEYKKNAYILKNANPKNYKSLLTSLKKISKYFGGLRYQSLTRQMGRDYVMDRLSSEKVSSVAAPSRELSLLNAALNFCYQEGKINVPPRIMQLPEPPPPRSIRLHLPEVLEFLEYFKENAAPHLYLFALLAFHTLSRKTAILELTWDRVSFTRKLIDFNNPERHERRKKRVSCPMNDVLYDALHKARQVALTDHVIEFNGRPVLDIKKGFKSLAVSAGYSQVTPHVLRHTGASVLVENGMSLESVAAFMGDRIATVEKEYVKFSPGYLKEESDLLNDLYQ